MWILRWVERVFQNAEWKLSLYNLLFGQGGLMVGGSAVAVWVVHMTETLNAYAPASYFVAALGTALAIYIMNALRVYAAQWAQVIRFRQRVHDTNHVNPMEDTFRKQRIRLIDLAPPVGGAIRNRTFIDCDIVGPANALFLPDCIFQNCGGEAVDGLIIREGSFARNGFGFENCTFRNCRFYLFTFMVPEAIYPMFATYNWRGLNWLTDNPGEAREVIAPPQPVDDQTDAPSGSAIPSGG